MMWTLQNIGKKESILLGLLGVSLTTVGATLLYEFYRKDNDRAFNRKRKSTCQMTSIEFKVPNSSVAAVIGKGGRTIREIEMKTGVTINIQKYSKCAKSDPTYRVCVISGSAESVKLAQIIVQNIIESVPVIDTYQFYVPYRAVKFILGKGRQNLQKIQEASNAKIIIDDSDLDYKSPSHPANYSYGDPSKDGKKRIVVYGTVEQIDVALDLIEQKVQQIDGINAVLQDLCPTKMPGAYTKLLTDELCSPLLSQIILSPLPPDDTMEVYVSSMETPGQFWVQIIGPGITYLESLVNEMSMYYDNEDNHPIHILADIHVGQIVAARCIYFDMWYRAEVTKILDKLRYEVFLLDYGVFLECTKENLLELRTDMLSLRSQAVECKLANIKPKKSEWSTNACKEFATCTWLGQSKIMDATVKGYIQRPVDYRRPSRPDAVVLCIELYDRYQKFKVGQHLVSLGLAVFDEDLHSKITDTATNTMRRQFLSIRLPTKTARLTQHIEEGETSRPLPRINGNEYPNEDKSASSSNIHNLTASQSKERSDIVPKWKNEAEISTWNANKDDAKHESKKDDAITLIEKRSDIIPKRKNKAEMSTLDANNDTKFVSKPDKITSLEERNNIVPERNNEAEMSTLDVIKDDAKSVSKPDDATTSVEKRSDIVSERKNEAEMSTLDAIKYDANHESKSDNVITSVKKRSDVSERKSEAEMSTLDVIKDGAKPVSKLDDATTSVEECSDIISERKNEAEMSTLDANNDAKSVSKPDETTTSLEERNNIVPERNNEAEMSTLDVIKDDAKFVSKPDDATTSVEERSDIISERKNKAEMSILDANNDAKSVSKPDETTTSLEERNNIVPERNNEAEMSTLDAIKDDTKLVSKPDDATSVEERSDIVSERKNEAEMSTLDANNDVKSVSKPDEITTSLEERNNIVPERNNEAEMSTLDANKDDAKHESKSDDVIISMEERSDVSERKNEAEMSTLDTNNDAKSVSKADDITTSLEGRNNIVPQQNNEAEMSMLDANKDDAKLESISDDVTTSVKKHSDIVSEQKSEADILTLDTNKDDTKSESQSEHLSLGNQGKLSDSN